MTRFSVWLPHGTQRALGLRSRTLFCTPCYFPCILLPLSYGLPRQSKISRCSVSRCPRKSSSRPLPVVSSAIRKPTEYLWMDMPLWSGPRTAVHCGLCQACNPLWWHNIWPSSLFQQWHQGCPLPHVLLIHSGCAYSNMCLTVLFPGFFLNGRVKFCHQLYLS